MNKTYSLLSVALTLGSAVASLSGEEPTKPGPAKEEDVVNMREFFVNEKNLGRAANAITPADTVNLLPGTTVEKLLSKVPGVNIVTRDPFGFYEFGNDIRVRSFGINQVGVTIDDVPMGSNSPRYGLPSGRVTDSENIANVIVSQGAGDLTTPAYEALGGSIKYSTVDPFPTSGAILKVSTGSADSTRIFGKYNIGQIIPGLSAWVSASQLSFKEPGIPELSKGKKVEAKITYAKGAFK